MLNKELLTSQGVSKAQEEFLLKLYDQLNDVLSCPDKYEQPVSLVESLEYKLQDSWKFVQDRNRHKYWYRIAGCCCPYMDNKDRWGTPYRIYNSECKWHGENV